MANTRAGTQRAKRASFSMLIGNVSVNARTPSATFPLKYLPTWQRWPTTFGNVKEDRRNQASMSHCWPLRRARAAFTAQLIWSLSNQRARHGRCRAIKTPEHLSPNTRPTVAHISQSLMLIKRVSLPFSAAQNRPGHGCQERDKSTLDIR